MILFSFFPLCQFGLAAGIIGFWVFFFMVENKNPEKSQIYLHYERSFPLPDLGWLVPSLLIAGFGLLGDAQYGYIFTIISGGSLIFLGLVDISFNLQNGGYTSNRIDTLMNLVINGICIIFGPVSIIWGSNGLL